MTRKTERAARLAQKVRLAKEATLPTVEPETVKMILAREAAQPMRAGNAELSHASLFGDAHKQINLF